MDAGDWWKTARAWRKPLNQALFSARIKIEADGLKIDLEPQSVFTRSFKLSTAGRAAGEIRPVHAFTRRAVIDCDAAVPETLQLFSFWLVLLSWRRAARNNNSSASS